MDIRTYLQLVISHWRLFLVSVVVTATATLVFTLQQPRIYESTSTFVIRPHSSLILQDEFVSTLDTLSRRVEINNTFAEVTNSKLIKDRAAEKLGLTSDQRQGLSASGRVLAGTNILRLTVQGRDPEIAQAFAGAVSEETVTYVSSLYDVFELGQLDGASLSRTPVSPNLPLNLAIGLVLGGALGLMLIFIRVYLGSPGALQRHFDIIDPESGVYNQAYLEMRLRQEVSRARNSGGLLSLALICVSDRSSAGFRAGGNVMPSVATIFEPLLRDEDLLARYNESTFALILPDLSGYEAQATVEKMRLRLGAAPVGPEHLQRMASLRGAAGVAELQAGDTNEDSLLDRAMEALNEAERGTYGRVVLGAPPDEQAAPAPETRPAPEDRPAPEAPPRTIPDNGAPPRGEVAGAVAESGVAESGVAESGVPESGVPESGVAGRPVANGALTNGAGTNGTNGAGTNGAGTNGTNGAAGGRQQNDHSPVDEEREKAGDSVQTPEPAPAPSLTRAALRLTQQYNLDPAKIEGTGKDGRILKSDVKAYIDSLSA